MQKVTSLILQIAMVMGAIYYRVNEARAIGMAGAQEQAGANVTRALELLKQAREAMGGEDVLKTLQSLSISGTSRRTFQDQNGQTQERSGKIQLYLGLSDKFVEKEVVKLEPTVEGAAHDDRFIFIKRAPVQAPAAGDQSQESGASVAAGEPHKRVMRLKPGEQLPTAHPMGIAPVHFLLTSILGAPAPLLIEYSYAGETRTEAGNDADIVEAKYPGGLLVRLLLDKQTHLPLSLAYRSLMPPIGAGNVIMFRNRTGQEGEDVRVIMPAPEAGHVEVPDVLIKRPQIEEEDIMMEGNLPPEKFQKRLPPPQEVEAQVSFSDYRAVNGILLPHHITQTFSNKTAETWEVEKYEINSPPKLGRLKKQD